MKKELSTSTTVHLRHTFWYATLASCKNATRWNRDAQFGDLARNTAALWPLTREKVCTPSPVHTHFPGSVGLLRQLLQYDIQPSHPSALPNHWTWSTRTLDQYSLETTGRIFKFSCASDAVLQTDEKFITGNPWQNFFIMNEIFTDFYFETSAPLSYIHGGSVYNFWNERNV